MDLATVLATTGNDAATDQQGDWLTGGLGKDLVVGTNDNDALFGGGGSDILAGGAGDDYLNGDDNYILGGTDWFDDSYFSREHWFEADLDRLPVALSTGDTWIVNSRGEVRSLGVHDDAKLDGSPDALYGGGGDDRLIGLKGDDTLDGGVGRDVLLGGADNDLLIGGPEDATDSDDALAGGEGDDVLLGGGGNDVLMGGTGRDVLMGGDGDDDLRGAAVYAALDRNWARIETGAGLAFDHFAPFLNDEKVAQALQADGNDFYFFDSDGLGDALNGGAGNDMLVGGAGDDQLFGEEDNDSLNAGRGNDLLEGGTGDDWLLGGYGSDALFGGDGIDKLYGDADYSTPWGVTGVEGDDYLDGGAGDDELHGGGGDDILMGGEGSDILWGDAGADILDGGAGNDTIYLDGQDTLIKSAGTDTIVRLAPVTPANQPTLVLADFAIADVNLSQSPNTQSLVLAFSDEDSLTFEGGFLDGGQQYEFADDTLNQQQLMQHLTAGINVLGTGDDDTVWGSNHSDTISGGDGDDTLHGQGGNDLLQGGAGADTLDGGAGNDTIYLSGADTVIHSTGTDVLHWATAPSPGDGPTIAFGDLTVAAASVAQAGSNAFRLSFASGDSLTIVGGLLDWGQSYVFANGTLTQQQLLQYAKSGLLVTGTAGDDTAYGSNYGDTLRGGTGNDLIAGQGGSDLLEGEDGDDTLIGGDGVDTLRGGAGADILDGGSGSDTLDGGEGSDTYVFGKGYGQDTLKGSYDTAADRLNVLQLSNDVAPTELVAARVGDSLVLSISGTTDKLTVQSFFSYDDPANPYNPLQEVRFADGTVWDLATITTRALTGTDGDDALTGTVSADTLSGGLGNDTLYGRGGGDVLHGGAGADKLNGDAGDDTYFINVGDGQDVISDTSGVDTVVFGPGIEADSLQLTSYLSDDGHHYLRIGYDTVGGSILIRDDQLGAIDNFQFADGTSRSYGELISSYGLPLALLGTEGAESLYGGVGDDALTGFGGNDTLVGGGGNDSLDGGAGNDHLEGGAGNDSYRLHWGMGQDTVIDHDGQNVLRLDSGIALANVAAKIVDNDLWVYLRGTNDGVLIQDYATTAAGWELQDATGSAEGLASVLARSASSGIESVQDAIARYEAAAKADYFAERGSWGFVASGPDSMHKETVSITSTQRRKTIEDSYFQIVVQESDDANIVRSSVPITHTLVASNQTTQIVPYYSVTAGSDALGIGSSGVKGTFYPEGTSLPFGVAGLEMSGQVQIIAVGYGNSYASSGGQRGLWVFETAAVTQTPPSTVTMTYTTNQYAEVYRVEEIVGGSSDNTIYHGGESIVVAGGDGNDLIEPFEGWDAPAERPWWDYRINNSDGIWARSIGAALDGGGGNDTVIGSGGDDELMGGTGENYLDGTGGGDTYYVFAGMSATDIIMDTGQLHWETRQGGDPEWFSPLLDWYYPMIGISDWKSLRNDPDLPKLPQLALNDYVGLAPFLESGVIPYDTVEFGEGISFADLQFTWGQYQPSTGVELGGRGIFEGMSLPTIDITVSPGQVVRVVVPPSGMFMYESMFEGSSQIDMDKDDMMSYGGFGFGIEQLRFADGTVLSMPDVLALLPSPPTFDFVGIDNIAVGTPYIDDLYGGDGNDQLNGANGDDFVMGGAGNDILEGGAGNDMVAGNIGDDSLDGGDGNDSLDGGTGNDVLMGGQGYDQVLGGNGSDLVSGGTGGDVLWGDSYQAEVNLANSATHGRDALDGGAGNDELFGGEDGDLYLVNRGSGVDTVSDTGVNRYQAEIAELDAELAGLQGYAGATYASSSWLAFVAGQEMSRPDVQWVPADIQASLSALAAGVSPAEASAVLSTLRGFFIDDQSDVVQFGAGIAVQNLRVTWSDGSSYFDEWGYEHQSGSVVVIDIGNGDSVILDDPAGGHDFGIEIFRFADGTEFGLSEILALDSNPGRIGSSAGSEGNDVLVGGAWGLASGFAGDDLLVGRGVAGSLDGGEGNDILVARGGNGSYNGGGGDDVYFFNAGDGGHAYISEWSWPSPDGGTDTLSLGGGITPDSVTAALEVMDWGDGTEYRTLHLHIGGSSQTIEVNWTTSYTDWSGVPVVEDYRVEHIQFVTDSGVQVFDLAALVADRAADLEAAFNAGTDVALFGPESAAFDITAQTAVAGGEYARIYATTGTVPLVPIGEELPAPNRAPAVGSPVGDQQASEDGAFILTVPADAFSDPDAGDSLTLSATLTDGTPLPTWLSFDAGTRTFSGTPLNADVGALAIRLAATDSAGASASMDFTLSIANSNDAPTAGALLADQAVNEDSLFQYTVSADAFNDVDRVHGDSLTLSATVADGAPLPAWLNFDAATATFSGTPENGDVGSLTVRVTATDTDGLYASQEFALVISNVNDAPVVPHKTTTLLEDWGLLYVSNALLAGAYDIDPTNDTLSIAAVGNAQHGTVSLDEFGKTLFVPDADYNGMASFDYTVSDGNGGLTTSTVTITVVPDNDAPTLTTPVADQIASEDAPFSFQVPTGTFSDVDAGDSLTCIATLADGSLLPAWLGFDAATATFTGTPGNGDVGVLAVRLLASDASGAAAAADFRLTVANVNDAPVANAVLADQTVNEDSPFQFTVPGEAFGDIDGIHGDVLSLSAGLDDGSPLPAWLRFDSATATFSGTPENADVGQITVRVTATDIAGATASSSFGLTVANTNDAPVVVNALADQAAAEGSAFSYQIDAGAFSDPDVGDALTYSATLADGSALPAWLSFDAASRSFSGTPGNGTSGNYDVRVSATDGSGASVADELRIAVADTLPTVQTGTSGSNTLTGSSDYDLLQGLGGADVLYGYGGNDTLDGGAGGDLMYGGTGDDVYIVDNSRDVVVESASQGVDSIHSSVGLILGSNLENLVLTGTAAINGIGNELDNVITGNASANILIGAGGADTLEGGGGNDVLIGDTSGGLGGSDILRGGSGNDLYGYAAGYGQDVIQENDATPGNQDLVYLDSAALAVGLAESGSNLTVSIHGDSGSLTVQDWYAGAEFQTEVFVASDGSMLLSTQVDQLIQAMAQFSVSTGLSWDQAIEQRPEDVQAIVSAYWQPAA